jgi:hypothetical protein
MLYIKNIDKYKLIFIETNNYIYYIYQMLYIKNIDKYKLIFIETNNYIYQMLYIKNK